MTRAGACALQAATLALSLALAGCGDWNEKRYDFSTYADFSASKLASNGLLPPDLVPRSASNIHVVYNMDNTTIKVEFDFAATEEGMIELPFLTENPAQFRQLVEEGKVPRPASNGSSAHVRCLPPTAPGLGPLPVEFLLVQHHTHARYWTTFDKKLRATSCPHATATA